MGSVLSRCFNTVARVVVAPAGRSATSYAAVRSKTIAGRSAHSLMAFIPVTAIRPTAAIPRAVTRSISVGREVSVLGPVSRKASNSGEPINKTFIIAGAVFLLTGGLYFKKSEENFEIQKADEIDIKLFEAHIKQKSIELACHVHKYFDLTPTSIEDSVKVEAFVKILENLHHLAAVMADQSFDDKSHPDYEICKKECLLFARQALIELLKSSPISKEAEKLLFEGLTAKEVAKGRLPADCKIISNSGRQIIIDVEFLMPAHKEKFLGIKLLLGCCLTSSKDFVFDIKFLRY